MIIQHAEFLLGVPKYDLLPLGETAEVCMVGRSNVGKSSLINALLNRKKLAKVSNTPGKTREINLFTINDGQFYLVDLPGYGFAKVAKTKKEEWGKELQRYVLERPQLRLIVQLVDIRHDPSADDQDFMYWLALHQRPFAIALTKADKLSKNQQQKNIARLRRILHEMNIEVPIVLTSSEDKQGIPDLLSLIGEFIND